MAGVKLSPRLQYRHE